MWPFLPSFYVTHQESPFGADFERRRRKVDAPRAFREQIMARTACGPDTCIVEPSTGQLEGLMVLVIAPL
jgi:hypothetical protein